MLDIKVIRSDPELVKKAMINRQQNLDSTIDKVLEIDEQRRKITQDSHCRR